MRAVLSQSSDLDEALESFGKRKKDEWTAEKKRKDQLWLKLESICMFKDLTSKMHMKMKLFTYKLQESDFVLNHISVFKEIIADPVSMEVQFDDEDLGLLLLYSLPNSYANFRDTILLSRDELTLAEVYEIAHMSLWPIQQMRVELCAKRSPAAAAAASAWKDAMEKGFARMDDEATSWAKSSSREEFEQVKDFSICFTNEVGVRAGQAVAPVARARRCHG
uniref:Uncharacterized protein n=1 Tax=Oryza sativa subsp. japonica TaxID=39947 RepID=Q2R4I4_ORYSJ|nr:hypothetical protein LOC_Os11g28370 [Oryza sativa Japonica Group]